MNLPSYLCLLALSFAASVTPLVATNPAVSQPQTQTVSPKPSFPQNRSNNIPIERLAIKASRLHQGMTLAQVEKVMGKPTDTRVFPNLDMNLKILNYRQEPIITKVSMIDGRLSGVTCELTTLTNNNIPRFARGIRVGMSREDVLKLMGKPVSERRNDVSSYKIERLIYVKNGEPAANVILADDRVEGVNISLETPAQILKVILPATPIMPTREPAYQRIRIGMNQQQVTSIYGQPDFIQPLEYENQKVVNYVYARLNTNASTRFTFINDVLTRYSFIPQSYLYHAK